MKNVCLCLSLALGASAFAAPDISSPLAVDPDQSTAVMTALTLDPDGYEGLRNLNSFTMTDFVLGPGVSVDLELARREVYAPDARLLSVTDEGEVELPRPDVMLFGGHVADDLDSVVFLAFSPYGVEGYIEAVGQTWIVSSGPFDQDLPIGVYNLTTLPEGVINWAQWECAADQLGQNVHPIDPNTLHTPRGVNCFLLEFAVETDQEYLGLFGGDQNAANTYIATLFGAVGEIYSRDFGAETQVVWSRLWTTTDPWNQSSTTDQLFQYRDYWEANMGSVAKDLGHFLSGRGLGGGVAWLPGICNSGFNYGLSANLSGFFPYPIQDNNSQNWDLMVVAHEGGHNVGAPHTHDIGIDNCANGDCSVTPNGTIMSYCHLCPGGLANVLMQFHPVNINNHILPTLNGATCDIEGNCENITMSFPNGLPSIVSPDGTTTIAVAATGSGGITPLAGTGMFHYDTGGGFASVPMADAGAGQYVATVPASNCGGDINFYFSVQGSNGQTYLEPTSGSYSAVVAEGINTIISMDFESDPGWTVNNIDLTDGGWDRGVPVGGGDRGDPATDADGSGQCWLTDNVDGNSDVDGGPTQLISTNMDLSGTSDPIFRFARWFTRDDGEGDDSFTVEFSDDGGANWTLADSTSTGMASWQDVQIRVLDHVGLTNQFRVRFSTWDNPNNSVVEAGVDALAIEELVCGSDCQADRNGDGQVDFFDVLDFLADYDNQDPSADMNNDGSWDFFDVLEYLNVFAAGCP